jgi:hypothetical protein
LRFAHWYIFLYYESVIVGESINILFFVLYCFELYVKLGLNNLIMAIFHEKTFYWHYLKRYRPFDNNTDYSNYLMTKRFIYWPLYTDRKILTFCFHYSQSKYSTYHYSMNLLIKNMAKSKRWIDSSKTWTILEWSDYLNEPQNSM